MNTHVFKLPSGVECEVKEFTGKQQRILTEQSKKPFSEKLSEMLASVIVRVGTKTDITEKFVNEEMLSCDKNFALVEARQFSLDFEEEFTFMFKYEDAEGVRQEVEISEEIPSGHFPFEPVKKLVKDGDEEKLVPADYKEYSEIEKNVLITLPKSGVQVRFTMLDGKGEKIGQAVKKTARSLNTNIEMRNPVYFEEKRDKAPVPVRLNLDNLHIKDIEFLRKQIKEYEGHVHTEISFEHPEADNLPASQRTIVQSVMGSMAFFFPSEAI